MSNKNQKAPEKEKDPYAREGGGNIFRAEGPLMSFLTKTGQIILLNIVWVLCCLPIVTIGPATTSFYYAMMKNIRRNRSYPLTEFWASFKRTLGSGILLTIGFGAFLFALWYLNGLAPAWETDQGKLVTGIYVGLAIVAAMILVYLFPVLSRFSMRLSNIVKLAFVMSVRFIYFTIPILVGTAALAWLWFYYLPLPLIVVWPGLWCFACTFLIEKALRRYMPKEPEDDGEDHWYYE